MKVLMHPRRTIFSAIGGDGIQLLKTRDALVRMGVSVEVSLEEEPDLQGFDLVHVFHLSRPQDTCLQVLNARKQGRKVVLSTIFGDSEELNRKGTVGIRRALAHVADTSFIEYSKILGRVVSTGEISSGVINLLLSGYRDCQKRILENTDMCLPNSSSEWDRICHAFPEARFQRHLVVPNGIDPAIFNSGEDHFAGISDELEKYVLCVGRIESRKNQLNLVRAFKNLPYRLVLIGPVAPNHMGYYRRILKEAGPNVTVLGEVPHDELPRYYHSAKVHALVSWLESTGLSSLEAAAMGCNIVITDKGDAKDYFGDFAYYCDPASIGSIRQAIESAYATPHDPCLDTLIQQQFTWRRAAELTYQAYKMTLE